MLNQPPIEFVRVGREAANPLDLAATQQLLDLARTREGYKCPKCGFSTADAELMLNHLANEINNSLAQISSLTRPLPPREKEI